MLTAELEVVCNHCEFDDRLPSRSGLGSMYGVTVVTLRRDQSSLLSVVTLRRFLTSVPDPPEFPEVKDEAVQAPAVDPG